MSKTPSVPGTDRPAEKAAGHWLLAQLGKKVLRPELKEEIQKDLARTIRVNARPLTVAEWTALAEEAGFEVLDVYQTDMALLEPKRLLADEGPAGVAKIAFNLARKPQIRERVLGMRGVFRRHADHIGAIGLILRKK